MSFTSTPPPCSTPWGAPQSTQELVPGIWQVSTARQGGLLLSEERQAAMPNTLVRADAAYEENIEWAAVYIGFEDEFTRAHNRCTAIRLRLAHDTLQAWHPHAYAAFTGNAVNQRESPVLQKIAAFTAAIGQYVVVSAFGDWADWVPKGMTGVIARRVIGVTHLGFAIYEDCEPVRALCHATRYDPALCINTLATIGAERC